VAIPKLDQEGYTYVSEKQVQNEAEVYMDIVQVLPFNDLQTHIFKYLPFAKNGRSPVCIGNQPRVGFKRTCIFWPL
jgi:hypothetical protein